jgi:hypothetical protein
MNCAIFATGTDRIIHFIKNCIRCGEMFYGDGIKLHVKMEGMSVRWTNDESLPTYRTEEGGIQWVDSWDKTVSELTEEIDSNEIIPTTDADYIEALKIRKLLSSMTYQGVEDYINNNVTDLAGAKQFIIRHAKVTLAIIKMLDRRK